MKNIMATIGLTITAACASAGGMRSASLDKGEVRFYAAPLPTVAAAAREAVLSAGLNVDTVSQPDSLTEMIIATHGMSAFSYGELVRVVSQRTSEGPVAVRVLTKRRLATNIAASGDWSGKIFERLDQILTQPDIPSSDLRVLSLRSLQASRVRVSGRGIGTITGSVLGVREGALWLDGDPGGRRIPVSVIDSVWVRKGHATTGSLVGVLIGTALGAAAMSHQHCFIGDSGCFQSAVAQGTGIMIGSTIIGAIIGSATKTWRRRYP